MAFFVDWEQPKGLIVLLLGLGGTLELVFGWAVSLRITELCVHLSRKVPQAHVEALHATARLPLLKTHASAWLLAVIIVVSSLHVALFGPLFLTSIQGAVLAAFVALILGPGYVALADASERVLTLHALLDDNNLAAAHYDTGPTLGLTMAVLLNRTPRRHPEYDTSAYNMTGMARAWRFWYAVPFVNNIMGFVTGVGLAHIIMR